MVNRTRDEWIEHIDRMNGRGLVGVRRTRRGRGERERQKREKKKGREGEQEKRICNR